MPPPQGPGTPAAPGQPPAPQQARPAHATPAADLAAREAARKAAAGRGDERLMSLTSRYSFRHASAPRRPPPPPRVPLTRRPPPRPQARPQPQPAHQSGPLHDVPDARGDHADAGQQRHDDDAAGYRPTKVLEIEDRDGSGDTFHDEGKDEAQRRAARRRLAARPATRRTQPPATQVLARSGLPEAAALFVRHGPDARDPQQMLKLLAALLVACSQPHPPGPHKPTPTATLLAGLQVHMASQLEAAPEPLTLGEVKALLMDCRGAGDTTPVADEKAQNAWLLLPLYLLNATRHRTDEQRRQAIERLQQLRSSQGLS